MEGGPLPLQRVSPPYYLNPLLSRIALRLGTVTVMHSCMSSREIQVCIPLIAFGALPRMSLAGHSLSPGGETLVSDIGQERQPLGLNSPTLTSLGTSVLWSAGLSLSAGEKKTIRSSVTGSDIQEPNKSYHLDLGPRWGEWLLLLLVHDLRYMDLFIKNMFIFCG